MKQRTLNMNDCFSFEIKRKNGLNMCIVFQNDKYAVQIHLEFWWINYIAREIWKFIKEVEINVEDACVSMKGDS